ncbi:MAG TPA: spore cortex-lytic enzyme [Clostridia bacterium]|nr:MAG: Spore cortex-lytic enzyme precursor [Firmicutes bacterium ADurb.Bin248]HOG02036.1 spore cortex-lytic enzyme [Clostridia bacterium]HOS18025.1 spore cortex-lytic enzyme [Clostridia bacterium]HPK15458.1 spore cortex-lytic enzyme [Clostridia bacterium]
MAKDTGHAKFAVTLALALALCVLLQSAAYAASVLKVGSSGDEVVTLQTKLKRWGYYTGSIDGKFGTQTKKAVVYFQQKNGLVADGVVGPATAKAMGMALSTSSSGSSGASNSNSDLYLLARCVYGEARGEPYKGQVAVAAVILNRVKSGEFPDSISGVIYQSGAFDAVKDGQVNLTPDETSIKAATDAMNGWDPTNGCLFYYNPATSTNKWMLSLPVTLSIGRHNFCLGN